MNMIQNFVFEEHQVRVVERFGEPWFVAVDVCRVLELKNPRQAVASLDDDEKDTVHNVDGIADSRVQQINIISLPGLFALVGKSRKPVARAFDRWVRHVVLVRIARTGRFSLEEEQETMPMRVEPLPFDRRQALAEVREARLIFGPRAARALWSQSEHLPRAAGMEAHQSSGYSDEADDCLSHLLGFMVDEDMRSIADLLQSGETGALERVGLKPVDGGVWLDPSKPEMKALWKRTRWRDGLWISHLRRLPGVTGNHPRMSIGGHQCRPLWLPASLLMA